MKLQYRKNGGSTLLIVVISIAIVSVLATLLISMSSLSAKLKHWDRQLKQTVYYSESGMDQIYANIAMEVETILGKAFDNTTLYVQGAGFTEDSNNVQPIVNKYFREQFILELKKNDNFYQGSIGGRYLLDNDDMISKLNGFILQDTTRYGSSGIPQVIAIESIETTVETDFNNFRYIINGLQVDYTNDLSKLRTAINTDIVIEGPKFDYPLLIQESFGSDIPISDYAIIANKDLEVNANLSVTGNVYAGGEGPFQDPNDLTAHNNKGIKVQNASTLTMNGPMIITPSGINLYQGTVTINNSKVLANHITTVPTAGMSYNNRLNILGDGSETYLYDDLELNANGSIANIEGSYYGVSIGNAGHNTSSSIIVNGLRSSLDLSNAQEVFIPGLSYLDLNPTEIAPDTDDVTDIITGNYISFYKTGESISVRGNHLAYFMPFDYGLNAGRTTDYDDFFTNELGYPLDREYYAGKTITMLTIDIDARPDYFYKYFQKKKSGSYDLVPLDFTQGGTISIKLPNNVTAKGASVATNYDGVLGDTVIEKHSQDGTFNTDDPLRRARWYDWAIHKGQWYMSDPLLGIPTLPTGTIYEQYLETGNITTWNRTYNKATDTVVTFVSNKDITITSTEIRDADNYTVPYKNKGIIISAGNIVIGSGVNFQGLIIARGDIIVNGNASVTGNKQAVSEALASNYRFKTLIFKEIETETESDKAYLGSTQTNMLSRYGELIKFENWTKNKE